MPDSAHLSDRWTLEANRGGHPTLITVSGRVPFGERIEVVPAAEVDRLRAENERLRSYLTSIATFGYMDGGEAHHIDQLRLMAKRALASDEEDKTDG